MDNEPTTMPALLTQPGDLRADARSERGKPVYTVIFVISLMVLAGIVYFF
jgi:hypothetical protein